jgi:predicted hydrocarbon binding protein
MVGETDRFTWKSLGDIKIGRPNLGDITSVQAYRLFQFSLRHILEKRFGLEETENMFRQAGELAGMELAAQLDTGKPLFEFVADLQKKLLDLKIGILRVERADQSSLEFDLTVSEDLDCSGLPLLGRTICSFDEGLIAGLFKSYTGKEFKVKEIDCWTTGAKTCRFTVRPEA